MNDKATVTVTHDSATETQDIEIRWTGEGEPPEESNALLTCNLMVAVYKTLLITQGFDAVTAFVEENEHVWSQGMESSGPEGQPIPGWEDDEPNVPAASVKFRK